MAEKGSKDDSNDAGDETSHTGVMAHPLLRDESLGMNPVTLITGYYGVRGERIRHRVHEGALRLPRDALELIVEKSEKSRNEEIALPSLDSVVRPSIDLSLTQFVVTEVRNTEVFKDVISPEDGTVQTVTFSQTVAKNRLIVRDVPAERIRGGGGEDQTDGRDGAVGSQIIGNTNSTSSVAGTETAPSNEGHTLELSHVAAADMQVEELVNASTSSKDSAVVATQPPSHHVPRAVDMPIAEKPTDQNFQPPSMPATSHAQVGADLPSTSVTTANVARTVDTSASEATLAPSSNATNPLPAVSSSVADSHVSSTRETGQEPNVVSISGPAQNTTADQEARVIPLKKRPPSQWEQGKKQNEPAISAASLVSRPDWYQEESASTLEKAVLSEWFDGSAAHRTHETYIRARKKMMEMSAQLGHNRFLTATLARRSIPGDAGSLIRLHGFLSSYSLINADAINETAPVPLIFQKKAASWSDTSMQESLMMAVVEQVHKRPKIVASSDYPPVDWRGIADRVGHGTTPSDCERRFLSMQIDVKDGTVTPDTTMGDDSIEAGPKAGSTGSTAKSMWELIDVTDPVLVSTVVNAALGHTNDLSQAQRAATTGLAFQEAWDVARSEEDSISRILAEIVDLRMKKLESRMEQLDELECMLEAERVELELERRDLYTARCRHWFGGT
jgi:SWI/SNF related-matrix-associated actin-dependent regulator of chromatin subfamily C